MRVFSLLSRGRIATAKRALCKHRWSKRAFSFIGRSCTLLPEATSQLSRRTGRRCVGFWIYRLFHHLCIQRIHTYVYVSIHIYLCHMFMFSNLRVYTCVDFFIQLIRKGVLLLFVFLRPWFLISYRLISFANHHISNIGALQLDVQLPGSPSSETS